MINISNKNWLYHEYIIKNRGMKSIAKECNCGISTVSRYLRQFNIPIKAYNQGRRPIPPSREKHWRWNGGKYITREGYIKVVVPDGHPLRKTGHRYILEHRLVMEKHLGRYLNPKERIHHLDNNRQNNIISNLQLLNNQAEHGRISSLGQIIYHQLWDKQWLEEKYLKQKMTLVEIAKIVGCSEGQVRNVLDNLGIPRRRYTLTELALEKRLKGAKVSRPHIKNRKKGGNTL